MKKLLFVAIIALISCQNNQPARYRDGLGEIIPDSHPIYNKHVHTYSEVDGSLCQIKYNLHNIELTGDSVVIYHGYWVNNNTFYSDSCVILVRTKETKINDKVYIRE